MKMKLQYLLSIKRMKEEITMILNLGAIFSADENITLIDN
jgi:hypothetical protein